MRPRWAQGGHHLDSAVHELTKAELVALPLSVLVKLALTSKGVCQTSSCKEYTSKYRKFYAIWLRRKRQQQHEQ